MAVEGAGVDRPHSHVLTGGLDALAVIRFEPPRARREKRLAFAERQGRQFDLPRLFAVQAVTQGEYAIEQRALSRRLGFGDKVAERGPG